MATVAHIQRLVMKNFNADFNPIRPGYETWITKLTAANKKPYSMMPKLGDFYFLCLCSAKQSIGIKDSKCPEIVQRQQQHQQQAQNSKGEIQGSQISLMRKRSGSGR